MTQYTFDPKATMNAAMDEAFNTRVQRMLDEAHATSQVPGEFAASKGVPGTLTDAEAALGLRMHSGEDIDGGEVVGDNINIVHTTGVFTSPDKYVGETANAIEAEFPNKVIKVNRKVYKPDGSTLTDFDIELDDIVIQVKSGSGKKLTSQLMRTQTGTDKIVIGYAPDLNPSSALVRGARAAGFEVFTSWEDLLAYLLNH